MANRHKSKKIPGLSRTVPDQSNQHVVASAEGKSVAKDIGMQEGNNSVRRLDRLRRRTGGRVGADRAPLSSAAKCS